MPPKTEKDFVAKMWLMTLGAIVLIGGGVLVVAGVIHFTDPEYTPAPRQNTISVDAGVCSYRADRLGGELEVRRRPARDEMVVGSIPHDVPLDVVSVRVDFIEIRGPIAGFVDRRHTRADCQ